MSGASWRHPGVLRCPVCIKVRGYGEDARYRSQMRAAAGIEVTGRKGKKRGPYHRPTVEVRHDCGHVWFTTHFTVNEGSGASHTSEEGK